MAGLVAAPAFARHSRARLPLLVLAARDVPASFKQEGRGLLDDARASVTPPITQIADEHKWGRLTGYTIAFRKRSLSVGIVATIRGSVSVYGTTQGARAALAARDVCNGGGLALRRVAFSGLPGGAVACSGVTPMHAGEFQTYVVCWQQDTLVGSVIALGQRGAVTTHQLVALARAQDSRMAHR